MTKSFARGALIVLAVLAFGATAEAASPYSLPGTSVVIPVGDRDYYRPDVDAYGPTILHDDNSYLHDPDSAGADEIRELQRAFPQTIGRQACVITNVHRGGKKCVATA